MSHTTPDQGAETNRRTDRSADVETDTDQEPTPTPTPVTSRYEDSRLATLDAAYALIATGFAYPEDVPTERVVTEASGETVPAVANELDADAARSFADFLVAYEDLDLDTYLDTLELDPTCAPYLGHHVFGRPSTCRDVADADRNQFMVELTAIYEHFDLDLEGELADYVPAMAEFLRLSLDGRDEELRDEFLTRLLELLPAMIDAFEDADTLYADLLNALYRVAAVDLNTSPATAATTDDIDTAEAASEPNGGDR